MNKNKIRGFWFYGMSGSGKSFISVELFKKIENAVIVDGDEVRKIVSKDLGYEKKDRIIQINRIFGLCHIIIKSKKFPLASTVYFNNDLKKKCNKIGIIPIKVKRKSFLKVKKDHKTYKKRKNVVGIDIFYEKFKTPEILNENNKNFITNFKLFKSVL